MLLTSKNFADIKYKTKRISLDCADVEINVALIPVSIINDAKKSVENGDSDAVGIEVLKAAIVDDDGNPVFETYESFSSLPPAMQKEIMSAIWDYNGLSGLEDAEKNLEKTQD